MINLNDLYYFVQVVDHEGFAAAARALALPKSSLNRRIIELETQLGASLIHRTSRRFAVTDAGREFYQHALGALVEAEAAECAVRRLHSEPIGIVRFSCSASVAQFALATMLPRFLTRFPKVHLVQHATNRYVDLLEENLDVAIRAHEGDLPDSSLIQRRLLYSPRWLVAKTGFFKPEKLPTEPGTVAGGIGIAFGTQKAEATWRLDRGTEKSVVIPFEPIMHTDDLATVLEATKAGLGIASLPAFVCRRHVDDGILERILPDWTSGGAHITALLHSRRNLLPSVRVFLDFLVSELPIAMVGDRTTNDG